MAFNNHLTTIIEKTDLDAETMASMIEDIFSGKITDSQIGAFMAALATKGETFEELAGAARAMRRNAARIQTVAGTVVDTCGTGGDQSGSFNVSTTTALVVAGCGVTVAKHGNRSVSSTCGSADVLEALGVNLDLDPDTVEEAVNEIGIGFLFAPKYHGAMKYAARARKELGIRSIFNMLGPLTNPAGTRVQLLGVFRAELTEMFAQALNLLGARRAFVVHGHDGMDEITVCAPTRISELKEGMVRTFDLNPLDFFDDFADPQDLKGGDAATNAGIIQSLLGGEMGPRRNIVLINTAAALVAAGEAKDLKHGIQKAENAIDSNKAADKLNQLITFTQENA